MRCVGSVLSHFVLIVFFVLYRVELCCVVLCSIVSCCIELYYILPGGGGGGGLPYITDGEARRNFQKQPLKITILGVAPANFIP